MVNTVASLRATARLLEIDPKTVVLLAAQLQITTPWKQPPTRVPEDSILFEVPEQMEPKPSVPKARARVDWKIRDQQVRQQISNASKAIMSMVPPVRVTTAQIERICWNRGWLAKRSKKLPVAMRCLRESVESVEQFQYRRASWVIQDLVRGDEALQVWRVLRRAGLTSRHAAMVEALLQKRFEERRELRA